jgi:macrolide-specific efflux system membrane fusion protein
MTARQRAAGLLVLAACLGGVALYVGVLAAMGGPSFTGAVTSNGLVDLNFARAGQVAEISVHAGQNVRSGQVLATETAAAALAAVAEDEAAIQADQATLAQLDQSQSSGPGTMGFALGQAKLAKDKAQLAVDQAAVVGMRIVAPVSGTVIAVNGQAGETVTAVGIQDYAVQSQGSAASPSATAQGSQISVTSAVPVPVIMLRTSRNWQVETMIPENSMSAVKPGAPVTVAVPAAHLSGVPGRVEGMLPSPVRTAQGVDYQVLVMVLGDQADPPLSGMATDIRLAS